MISDVMKNTVFLLFGISIKVPYRNPENGSLQTLLLKVAATEPILSIANAFKNPFVKKNKVLGAKRRKGGDFGIRRKK